MPGLNAVSGPDSENESVSISARKIDNGYIVCESRSKGSDYTYSETFTDTKPNLSPMATAPKAEARPNPMQRAVEMMGSALKPRSK